MHVGTVAAGRIGLAVLRRLKPFEVSLHYSDRHRLPEDVENELGVTHHAEPCLDEGVRCGYTQRSAPSRDGTPVQ